MSVKRIGLCAVAVSLILCFCCVCSGTAGAEAATSEPLPAGWLTWHRYSSYAAKDSTLLVRDPAGTVMPLQGDFVHAMNGDFGSHPYDLVCMAIDPAADAWDLYRWNLWTGTYTNLTQNSGYRNEDPKFSPDGLRIVCKRGKWDAALNGFRYDLAELELRTGQVTMLTDTPEEESMPYYSADGSRIYFACIQNGCSVIQYLERESGIRQTIFAQAAVNAYYPIVGEDGLYFTKWCCETQKNDCIVRLTDGVLQQMPFLNAAVNCSDPCPLSGGRMLYSSTASGSYDLCYYDGSSASALHTLNTENQELGAAFYDKTQLQTYIPEAAEFLQRRTAGTQNYDADGDGQITALDLCILKRAALQEP